PHHLGSGTERERQLGVDLRGLREEGRGGHERAGLARAGRRQGGHGPGAQAPRGHVHDGLRGPYADGADELRRPFRRRRLRHLHGQPVPDVCGRYAGGHARGGPVEDPHPPAVPRRRLRAPARAGHHGRNRPDRTRGQAPGEAHPLARGGPAPRLLPVGDVRAVAPNYTCFAVETFVDELARLAGVDPVEYRLSMLRSAPRLARVLKLAAEKAAWGTPLPPNVGRGVACVSAQEKKSPTWTASVVEAQVDPATGRVRIRKVTCAGDCGIVVNPDGARAQIEGSVLFGV